MDQEIHPYGQGRIDSLKNQSVPAEDERMFISWVSGNLLGVEDGFPNTSLILVEHGYNVFFYRILLGCFLASRCQSNIGNTDGSDVMFVKLL